MTPTRGSATQEFAPNDVRRFLFGCELALLAAGPIVAAVTTPRVFSTSYSPAVARSGLDGLERAAAIVVNEGALGLGIVAVLAILPCFNTTRRGIGLVAGASLFFGVACLASVLAPRGGSIVAPVTMLALVVALHGLPPLDPDWFLRRCRWILRFYAGASLLAVVVAFDWAMESGYTAGVLPGLQIRLHGVVSHANVLAPMMLLSLIVDRGIRSRGPADTAWSLATLAVLLLTQSKTTWIAALAIVLVEVSRQAARGPRRDAQLTGVVVSTVLVGGVLLGITGVTGRGALDAGTSAGVRSISARQEVWDITLQAWKANPVLGYGLDLWGPEMRLRHLGRLGWAPPHAHNQFIQTLGETGLIGAMALVFFLWQYVRLSLRLAHRSAGVTLSLALLLMFRLWTEVPLRFELSNFLTQFMTLGILLAFVRAPSLEPAEAGAPAPGHTVAAAAR